MKQVIKKNRSLLLSLLSLLSFLLFWELSLSIWDISRAILIKPSLIVTTCIRDFDIISKEMIYTITEIVPGWIIGNLIGFLSALCVYRLSKISKMLTSISVLINSIPLIALAAIVGGIIGTNRDEKIFLISLIIFFPMFITTLHQLVTIDDGHKDLLSSYSATPSEILFKILLPKSFPAIFHIVKVSIITAIFTAITSEFFGGYGGIGIFILSKKGLFNLPLVWASILFIAIFGAIFYFSVEFLQKKLIPWQES